jgi:tRNA threonylcarbamoyladenosine biosynthesis protein TsaB
MNMVHAFDFESRFTTSGFIVGLSFSVDTGSVALRTAQGVVHAVTLEGHRSHSSDSLAQLHELMHLADLRPADCIAIAADIGPGGFTGLRTACGLAQGLAVGWNVPCITRTSLDILAFSQAHAQRIQGDGNGLYLAALDARQNEVYVALHELHGSHWTCIEPPVLLSYGSSLRGLLDSRSAPDTSLTESRKLRAACGNGVSHLLLDIDCLPAYSDAVPGAHALVELAAFDVHHGHCVPPEHCQPLYVREQMALTTAQRKARSHV